MSLHKMNFGNCSHLLFWTLNNPRSNCSVIPALRPSVAFGVGGKAGIRDYWSYNIRIPAFAGMTPTNLWKIQGRRPVTNYSFRGKM